MSFLGHALAAYAWLLLGRLCTDMGGLLLTASSACTRLAFSCNRAARRCHARVTIWLRSRGVDV